MSWQATEAVRLASRLGGANKSVAFALATFADERGAGARPSKPTLAEGSGTSPKTVKRALAQMVELGEIKKTGTHWIDANKWVNVYSLAPLFALAWDGGHPDPPTSGKAETGVKEPETGVKTAETGVTLTPNPLVVNPLVVSALKGDFPPSGIEQQTANSNPTPTVAAAPTSEHSSTQAAEKQQRVEEERRERLRRLEADLPDAYEPERAEEHIRQLAKEVGEAA
jgi:hypothetical protein